MAFLKTSIRSLEESKVMVVFSTNSQIVTSIAVPGETIIKGPRLNSLIVSMHIFKMNLVLFVYHALFLAT